MPYELMSTIAIDLWDKKAAQYLKFNWILNRLFPFTNNQIHSSMKWKYINFFFFKKKGLWCALTHSVHSTSFQFNIHCWPYIHEDAGPVDLIKNKLNCKTCRSIAALFLPFFRVSSYGSNFSLFVSLFLTLQY